MLSYRELVRNLVLKDLKLKYRDSALGFLWSLVNPLLLILVYSFVFGHVLRGGPANFAYFLMVGILPWNFFAQSLMMSTGSIIDNGSLIRKVALPMEVFPVATVLFSLAQYALALIVFFSMAVFFFEISPTWSWMIFIPVLVLQVFFTLGLAFIVSTATVFFRDVRHFTEILLTLVFWLTPIVYDINTVPQALKTVVYLNPLSYFILAYQDALYHGTVSHPARLIVLGSLALVFCTAGYTLFMGRKVGFPEEV
jgi:ABC-2 type transport system permease protein